MRKLGVFIFCFVFVNQSISQTSQHYWALGGPSMLLKFQNDTFLVDTVYNGVINPSYIVGAHACYNSVSGDFFLPTAGG